VFTVSILVIAGNQRVSLFGYGALSKDTKLKIMLTKETFNSLKKIYQLVFYTLKFIHKYSTL
jgi:hypothetical protein